MLTAVSIGLSISSSSEDHILLHSVHRLPTSFPGLFPSRGGAERKSLGNDGYPNPVLEINRPFAGSGHMVRNKLHWDASNAVGLSKQRKAGLDW